MQGKCLQALAKPKRFLAQVKSGKIARPELDDYVLAFDEGKYGCRENKGFVFKILDSFYSVEERKFSVPALLQRYAFNVPESSDPAKKNDIYNLLWLFTENRSYLPYGWTQDDARAFVERPEHWSIALAKFGKMRDRDDAVFASVADPQSRYFDRQLALKLWGYRSKNQNQRRLVVAALFADARFGPPDFALAESLLPVSALYGVENGDPFRQQARSIWLKIIEAYEQNADPALRAKGRDLRAKMAPPVLNGWPAFAPPNDGRVWLSLADWPQKVRNPFATVKVFPHLFTADDYPTRALREERTGMVTLAARFGPDGRFAAVEVVRSSGSADLDAAAAGILARRFKPKLSDLTIEGYRGREVMVPLLVVNWDISEVVRESGTSGYSHYSGGILSVVALSRDEPMQYTSCGDWYTPSVFL